jgi:hypothetical protein
MKKILKLHATDKDLKLYCFDDINSFFFVDIDGKIYYSDIVATKL